MYLHKTHCTVIIICLWTTQTGYTNFQYVCYGTKQIQKNRFDLINCYILIQWRIWTTPNVWGGGGGAGVGARTYTPRK